MNMYWSTPTIDGMEQEKRQLKSGANFSGIMVLAILAAMTILPSGIGMLLAAFQVLPHLDANGQTVLSALMYVLYIAAPALLVGLIARRDIQPFSYHRRVSPGTAVPALMAAVGLMILANMVASVISAYLEAAGIPMPNMPNTMDSSVLSLILNLVATAVLPALCEELVFRGYVLQALRPQGDGIAIVLSSLLFSLLHGNLLQIPFAFILGLVMAYLTLQTGNIWMAVALHFITNGLSVVLQYVTLNMGEQAAGILNTTVFLIASVIGVVGYVVLVARHRSGSTGQEDILRPVGNGFSGWTVSQRVGFAFSSPGFLIAVIALVLVTIMNTVVTSYL